MVPNTIAWQLIEEFDKKQGKDVYELEDAKLLPVTTLRVLCHWKLQKKANGKKDYLVNFWMQGNNNPSLHLPGMMQERHH